MNYPTRLVIPARKFTTYFLKLGYLGIKRVFDKNEIKYSISTIVQASDLKAKLERLDLKKDTYDNSILGHYQSIPINQVQPH